jgi:dTDP-4-amino-4,6-dideoxygalactose transaminase
MSGYEMKYIEDAFKTNWIAPLGPNVTGFENELSSYLKRGSVAALSSGTAAIHLALILLGIKDNDEVICSSFTFSASANPIIYQRAVPVFVDSEEYSWNMDPALLETAIKERIKNGAKPKAIIVVHLYGMPAKMNDIIKISKQYEIPIIEDAAEALGSKYISRCCGTMGDVGILSFNGNKIITTSGGGALVSDNHGFIERAKFYATQARDKAPHYQHSQIGYNYRMSNVVAGIGRGQLTVLEDRVKRRRENNGFYRKLLGKYDFISFQNEPEGHFSNYWLTTIIIKENRFGITREKIQSMMEEKNIETRPLWKPMHLQPVFSNSPAEVNGVSEGLFNAGLCLPSGSNLTPDELDRIESVLKKIFS